LQYCNTFINHIDQRYLTAVAGKTGIDFSLQVVVDSLVQRAVFIDHRHLGVGRLDSQLPAHTVSGVIDQRIFQKWLADAVDPSGKAFQGKWDIVGLFFTRLAISNAGFSVGRARLSDKNPDAD